MRGLDCSSSKSMRKNEMMKPFCGLAAAISVSLALLPTLSMSAEESEGGDILAEILARTLAYETTYVGSFSRREVTVRILDGRDGELEQTRHVVVDVWEYHGEHPINELLECRFDDEPTDLEECVEEQRLEPTHRLFGKDAKDHYRYEYAGVETWEGQASHRVRVTPIKSSSRHLKGDVFFLVDSLQIGGMEITLSKFPFGLKALSIKLIFEEKAGQPVVARGESSAHLHVPFLINRRSETAFSASRQRLLTERATPHSSPVEAEDSSPVGG